MPYDKNRGRAAGTPGFYRNVNKKHTHGENTGEWTREERARRERDEFKPRASRDGATRGAAARDGAYRDTASRDAMSGRPARPGYEPRPAHTGGGSPARRPAHGTRNSALSSDRPIYQDAFVSGPVQPRERIPASTAPHGAARPVGNPAGHGPAFDAAHPAGRGASYHAERGQSHGAAFTAGRGSAQGATYPAAHGPAVAQPPVEAQGAPAVDEELMDNLIVGRNPIREAIKNGRELERILVQRGELSGSAREIIARARENHIVVQEVDKARLDAIYPTHQGMIAYASAASYSSVEDILALAEERGEPPFIIVLDGITDPHNLGAIIRTAECVGAHGVIFQQRRSVGLTPAAVKAAAGATEYMRIARVVNITRTLADLKKRNIWVVGADMDGQKLRDTDLSGAVALVIGAEGEGISRLVGDECDLKVALPMRGHIQSLNASVAAGVLMYAVSAARGY